MLPDFRTRFPETLGEENIRPLTPEDVDLQYIRHELSAGGIKVDLSEAARASLGRKTFLKFSDPDGRGPGLTEAIGQDRVKPLLDLTYELMDTSRRLEKGNEKSAARGMRQWVADVIELASDPEPTHEKIAEFCLVTNQRVKKGYNSGEGPSSFDSVPDPKRTLASVPPDSIPKLWQFLTSPLVK